MPQRTKTKLKLLGNANSLTIGKIWKLQPVISFLGEKCVIVCGSKRLDSMTNFGLAPWHAILGLVSSDYYFSGNKCNSDKNRFCGSMFVQSSYQ